MTEQPSTHPNHDRPVGDTIRPDPRIEPLRYGAALVTRSVIEAANTEEGVGAVPDYLYGVLADIEGSVPPVERAAAVHLLVAERRTVLRQDLAARGDTVLRKLAAHNETVWGGMQRNHRTAHAVVLNGDLRPLTVYARTFAGWQAAQEQHTNAYLEALASTASQDQALKDARSTVDPAYEGESADLTPMFDEATLIAVAGILVAKIAQAQADVLDPAIAVALLVTQAPNRSELEKLKAQAAFTRRYAEFINSSARKVAAVVERSVGTQTVSSPGHDIFSEDDRQGIAALQLAHDRLGTAKVMVEAFLKPNTGKRQR